MKDCKSKQHFPHQI